MSGLRVARLPEGDLQRHKENTKSTFLLASANYGVELSRCKAILLTTVVKKKKASIHLEFGYCVTNCSIFIHFRKGMLYWHTDGEYVATQVKAKLQKNLANPSHNRDKHPIVY